MWCSCVGAHLAQQARTVSVSMVLFAVLTPVASTQLWTMPGVQRTSETMVTCTVTSISVGRDGIACSWGGTVPRCQRRVWKRTCVGHTLLCGWPPLTPCWETAWWNGEPVGNGPGAPATATAVHLGQTPSMSKPVLATTTSTSLSNQVLVTWLIVQVCNHCGLLVTSHGHN